MRLFSISISGDTLYFMGDISNNCYNSIETIINSIDYNSFEDEEIFLSRLTKEVYIETGCTITPINISHVFRKK